MLEDYLATQCTNQTYDALANLAVLKLYQFNPHLVKEEFVTNILAKALTAFPGPEFALCLHLLPPHLVVSEPISHDALYEPVQKLCVLASLLDGAAYASFWQTFDGDDLYADLVADIVGFEEDMRRGIAHSVARAMREVRRGVLEGWVNLKGQKFDAWLGEIGWAVEGDVVQVPTNKDNEVKSKVEGEKVTLQQALKVLKV